MNRRKFLGKVIKNVAIVCGGIAAYPTIRKVFVREPFTPPLTDEEKEYVIAQALKTPEGRAALANAMVEPIRNSLDYHGVGKKLLMANELPN